MKPPRRRSVSPAALLLGLFLPLVALVAGGCGVAPAYAAEVNGTNISSDSLTDELEALAANDLYLSQLEAQGSRIRGSGTATFDSAFVARVLTRQILLELIHQEVQQRDLEIDPEAARQEVVRQYGPEVFEAFPDDYQQTLLRRQAEIMALQDALAGGAVDEAAVEQFYEENQELFRQTCVRHILFAPQPAGQAPDLPADADATELIDQARQVRQQIQAGDLTFEEAAQQFSRDSAAAGGDLGCVGPGNFVPPFEEAMQALEPGQISEPVRTQFGIHLIQVTERRVPSLDEVRSQIRQRLQAEAQAPLQQWLQEAVAEAEVQVNPRYGRFSTQGSPGVIPPQGPTTSAPAPAGLVPTPAPVPGG